MRNNPLSVIVVWLLARLKVVLQKLGLIPFIKRGLHAMQTRTSTNRKRSSGIYSRIMHHINLLIEQANFADVETVHNLPEIFHYWSNKYLRPKLEAYGFSNPDEFFAHFLMQCMRSNKEKTYTFISIGSGNCDLEIRLARMLQEKGFSHFAIHCLDINDQMLSRGVSHAEAAQVRQHIIPLKGDFNHWQPTIQYDAVIANQSLHHVVELEHLFDAIATAIAPDGLFMTSDMIGCKGHQRSPEALKIVNEFWAELPAKQRYNHYLKRVEAVFENRDCSVLGFEGIRSQDILPLLQERFSFDLFIGFANLIDPFIDRTFGANFSVDSAADRAFIDRVHARDEMEMASGHIKPTHMLAVMRSLSVKMHALQ